jgi:hypothetical protein
MILILKRLLLGLIPAAVLVAATGCTVSGEEYAEPAGYYEGPTYYYGGPDVYVAPRWDFDHHHYYHRRYIAPRHYERSRVDVHAHFR